ncbi:MAG: autotransporter domain-containing protein [Elusimicrobiota bacterium]
MNATAGNATIINQDLIEFYDQSTAANATIVTNNGYTEFRAQSTGGNATIIANDNTSYVMFLDSSTSGNATLINNGGVVDFSLRSTTFTLTAGSMAGSGSFQLGSQNLTVGSNNSSTEVSGVISGSGGSLVKVGDGTFTLSGANAYTGLTTVQAGTLNLTGSLVGDAIVQSGGILSGSGSLGGLINNGIVTPGVNGVGALSAASYSGSGMLRININGSSATVLRVSGNANLTGSTLDLVALDPVIGLYDVLTAGSVTGVFLAIDTSSFPAYLSVYAEYTPTDVWVHILLTAYFRMLGETINQRSVGAALDASEIYAGASLVRVYNAISDLPPVQARSALDQMSGDSLAYFPGFGLRGTALFTDQMHERAALWASSTTAAGLWSRGVGFFDSIDGDPGIGSPAAHSATGGFQAGYDYPLADALLVGFSGGYARTSLTVDDRAMSGQSTLIQSGIYGRYTPGSWFLKSSVAYGGVSNNSTRNIAFTGINGQTTASFQSHVVTTYLEGGSEFKFRKSLSVEPSVSLRQSHLRQEGFTESGAAGLDLNVGEVTLDSLVSALGIRLNRSLLQQSAHPVTLGMSTAWLHEFGNTENRVSAQFVDAPGSGSFTVQGTPRTRNAATIGVNGSADLYKDLQAYADYTATIGSAQTNQAIQGGIKVKW